MKIVSIISLIKLLAGILGIVLIILKLFGTIEWSWLWVVSPYWIAAAVEATVLVLALATSLTTHLLLAFLKPKYGAKPQEQTNQDINEE